MGRLIYLDNLDLDPSWYFPDSYYNREKNKYVYPWPNNAYPHSVGIHSDNLSHHTEHAPIKVEIRNWVELNLLETVIVSTLDKSYRKYYDEKDNTWERSFEVRNVWTVFYFNNEHSATMFALRFSEHVQPITDTHPRYK